MKYISLLKLQYVYSPAHVPRTTDALLTQEPQPATELRSKSEILGATKKIERREGPKRTHPRSGVVSPRRSELIIF